MRSVFKASTVLSLRDRVIIFLRAVLALLLWLPVNIFAIPYVFLLGYFYKIGMPLLQPVVQLHEILPNLYLGTVRAATSKEILKEFNITTVLSLLDFDIDCPVAPHKYMRMEVGDHPHVDLLPSIDKAYDFVNRAMQQNERVLVHWYGFFLLLFSLIFTQ